MVCLSTGRARKAGARGRARRRALGDQLVCGVRIAPRGQRATATRKPTALAGVPAHGRDLGAQVVNLHDKHVADALIRYAQQESISHVVFGQSARSRWDILLRGSVLNRFLAEVRDVTVQVVPVQKPIRK
jgi:K+-sensing histidine kinase KdpD